MFPDTNAQPFRPGRGDLFALCAVLCVQLATPAPAIAQEVGTERPYRGLFGGGAGGPEQGQSLEMTWALSGANDDNDTGGSLDVDRGLFAANSVYGTTGANLSYTARGKSMAFTATGGSTGRYYRDYPNLNAFDAVGGARFVAGLGRRVTFNASQNFQYLPYYQMDFLAAIVPSSERSGRSEIDPVAPQPSRGYDGSAALQSRFGGRSTFSVNYAYRHTSFESDDEQFDWRLGNVAFSHGLTRYASLRLGYGYGTSANTFGTSGGPNQSHLFDVGVDYSRALSFSRRTTFSFRTGSASFSQDGRQQFLVTGDATLTREIGRSWTGGASYNRGVQYVAGFADPLLADTIQASISGLLSRRLTLNLSTGYSSGSLAASSQNYSTLHGESRLRVALNQFLSVDARYGYYRYIFDESVQLPLELPRSLNRHGLRIGLTGWLPLYR